MPAVATGLASSQAAPVACDDPVGEPRNPPMQDRLRQRLAPDSDLPHRQACEFVHEQPQEQFERDTEYGGGRSACWNARETETGRKKVVATWLLAHALP